MQQTFAALTESIKLKDNNESVQNFKRYCAAFQAEILTEVPQTFFAKLLRKQTPVEIGEQHFKFIIDSGILKVMHYLDFIQSLSPLFQVLLNPKIKKDVHIKSFKLLLNITSTLEENYEKNEYTLKNIGDIIIYGLQLDKFLENPMELYNIDIPETIVAIEQDDENLHLELYDIFISHIEEHIESFCFWWTILCESLFPIYFGPSSKTSLSFNKDPKFNFEKISEFLCSTNVNPEKISKLYPSYICFLISETSDNFGMLFFSRFYDFLENIFYEAADEDYSSVSSFIISVMPRVGEKIMMEECDSEKIVINKCNEIWCNFIKKNREAGELIFDNVAQKLPTNYSPTTVYTVFLMTYYLGKTIPKEIPKYIKEMGKEVENIACSFSGVLAVIFIQQLLLLTEEDMKEMNINDCGLFYSRIMTNHIKVHKIVCSVLITNDIRPQNEAQQFLKQFFVGWETNISLNEMCASFVKTIIIIIKTLPSNVRIDAKRVLLPIIDIFTEVALKTEEPLIVLSSVDIISLILQTRNIMPFITPGKLSRIALSHIKLLSLKNEQCVNDGLLKASESILSGNPILLTIVPFMETLIANESIQKLHPVVISALEYSVLFFFKNKDLIHKSVDKIESKMLKVLSTVANSLSSTASSYFIGDKRTDEHRMEKLCNSLLLILLNEIKMSDLEEVQISFIRLIHGFIAFEIDVKEQFNTVFQPRHIFSKNIINGMYSFVSIAQNIAAYNKSFIPHIMEIFDIYENPPASVVILAYQLCIASKEFSILRKFLEKIDQPDTLEVLLTFISERNTKKPTDRIKSECCASYSSQNAIQVLHVNEEGETFTNTIKCTLSSVHSFTKMDAKTEEFQKQPMEQIEICEEEEEVITDEFKTTQIFTKIIEETKRQHEENLLSTVDAEKPIPRKYKSMVFTDLIEKDVIQEEIKIDTPYDTSLAAIGTLGLYGKYGHEKKFSENETSFVNRILSDEGKVSFVFPVFFSKGGTVNWKWKDTSKSFQRFAHALNDSDLHDWRIKGRYDIVSANCGTNESQIIRIVWCDDGITVCPEEFKEANNLSPTVISIQPLRIGFVRVLVENTNVENLLLSETKVVPSQCLISLLNTTICTLASILERKEDIYSCYNTNKSSLDRLSYSFTDIY